MTGCDIFALKTIQPLLLLMKLRCHYDLLLQIKGVGVVVGLGSAPNGFDSAIDGQDLAVNVDQRYVRDREQSRSKHCHLHLPHHPSSIYHTTQVRQETQSLSPEVPERLECKRDEVGAGVLNKRLVLTLIGLFRRSTRNPASLAVPQT